MLKDAKPVLPKPSTLLEAMKYAEALKEPSVVSKAQIAKRFGVSRARVCQMLNLLELDSNIIKQLLSTKNVKETNYFSERRLRPLTRLSQAEQLDVFKELLKEIQF